MNNDYYTYESREDRENEAYERERLERRRQRRAQMRARRRRQVMINRCLFGAFLAVLLVGFIFLIKTTVKGISKLVKTDEETPITKMQGSDDSSLEVEIQNEPVIDVLIEEENETPDYEAHLTENTVTPGEDIISERSMIVDLSTGDILMQRGYNDRIPPASMTKVLTVLVAAEHLTENQLDDTFTITPEITGFSYQHGCSAVSWSDNEVVTVRDLLYGTILPSGADAALGLATYIAGSHEAFVDMMNEKLYELGLSETSHFTNCIGIYDDNHYSSLYDITVIMRAAIDNDIAREVLSTKKYTTSSTAEHPDGIEISNWFLRRIEDKDTGGQVIAAKTGYVVESKNCAVSYGKDSDGNEYIVCTQGATSSWRCIYDHVAIYKQFEGKVNNGEQAPFSDEIVEGQTDDGTENEN